MDYTTKNYADQGGDRWIVSGALDIVGEGQLLKNGVPLDLGGGSSNPVAWADVTNKPTTFVPATHNQDASTINAGVLDAARIPTLAQAKITNLSTDLAARILKTSVASLSPIATPASATVEELATAYNALLAALKA